jgi:RNA polymerase sigma-70 factor (ECF subfamily)
VERDRGAKLPSFEAIYDEHADFVWRSIRRLGLDEAAADDALQEVFLVVHRRRADFEGRSSLRTWLFGIAIGVVRNHRRSRRRKRIDASVGAEAALERVGGEVSSPHDHAARSEAVAVLYRLLGELTDDQREVFVMAELEQMRGTEIAEATGINLNTVYTRLKAARRDFNAAVRRFHEESSS